MTGLPNDPVMLLSVVNTALRDTHQDLDGFCRTRDVEKDEIISKLKTINYEYNVELNTFAHKIKLPSGSYVSFAPICSTLLFQLLPK